MLYLLLQCLCSSHAFSLYVLRVTPSLRAVKVFPALQELTVPRARVGHRERWGREESRAYEAPVVSYVEVVVVGGGGVAAS